MSELRPLSPSGASAEALREMKAKVLSALAHPLRIAIAESLADGERCVCDIAELAGGKRSNVSRHLALMTSAGLLRARKDGLNVYYTLTTPCALQFLECAGSVVREQGRLAAAVLEELKEND